jgi:hypothetical protein
VDEAARLSAPELSRDATTSSTSSKVLTPSLDPESGSETTPSLACSLQLEKIDSRLLAETSPLSIGSSTHDTIDIVDLTGLDDGMTPSPDHKGCLKGKVTTQSTFSKK